MWINVAYDTNTGMGCSVWGPYKTLRDAQDPAGVPVHVRETGCWTPVKLVKPENAEDCYSATGSAVVFDGDTTAEHWTFYGPFVDDQAASEWAYEANVEEHCAASAIELLKPVPVKEPA
jgi:hypothetical protein